MGESQDCEAWEGSCVTVEHYVHSHVPGYLVSCQHARFTLRVMQQHASTLLRQGNHALAYRSRGLLGWQHVND